MILLNLIQLDYEYFNSLNPKPFKFYPSQIDHKWKVVVKSNKLNAEQFIRLDFNNFRFDSKNNKKLGFPYNHLILVYGPVYCCCSTFIDLAYCHHILAINRLELANIILDQTYVKPVEPRRLFVRKTTKGRPKQTKGKALVIE